MLLHFTFQQPHQQRKGMHWSTYQMMLVAAQFLNSRTTAHIPGKMRAQIPLKETLEQTQDNATPSLTSLLLLLI